MSPIVNKSCRSTSPPWRVIIPMLWFISLFTLTVTQPNAAELDRAASIRGSIIALDSARKTALREFEGLSSSNAEVTDYRDFIVYLNSRIVTYCKELIEQGGPDNLEGLPCPSGPHADGSIETSMSGTDTIFYSTGSGATGATTQAEKTAKLDGDFLSALGDFDDMLLKEEDKVAARVPSQRETRTSDQSGTTGSGGSKGETNESGTANNEVSSRGEDGQSNGNGSTTGNQGDVGAGNADQESSVYGAPGGTLPPPKDDDIVARQLREAAEKEPDPELKKKLWEEYWKYKGRKT